MADGAVDSSAARGWNLGVSLDWTLHEAALFTDELSSVLGGKTPKASHHFRMKIISEWLRDAPRWHATAFQAALTLGYRKANLESVTLREVNNSIFPGLEGMIDEAVRQTEGVPEANDVADQGRDAVRVQLENNQISGALSMAETYVDIGGAWLEKFPRFAFHQQDAFNLLEVGIGVAIHLSGITIRSESGDKIGTATRFGWGGEISALAVLCSLESPESGWLLKPVVFEARLSGIFVDEEFFGMFVSAAISSQIARYF